MYRVTHSNLEKPDLAWTGVGDSIHFKLLFWYLCITFLTSHKRTNYGF
jgi:hypothetical protein